MNELAHMRDGHYLFRAAASASTFATAVLIAIESDFYSVLTVCFFFVCGCNCVCLRSVDAHLISLNHEIDRSSSMRS